MADRGIPAGLSPQFPLTLPGLTVTDGPTHLSASSNSRTEGGNLNNAYFHQNLHKHLAAFTPSLPKTTPPLPVPCLPTVLYA